MDREDSYDLDVVRQRFPAFAAKERAPLLSFNKKQKYLDSLERKQELKNYHTERVSAKGLYKRQCHSVAPRKAVHAEDVVTRFTARKANLKAVHSKLLLDRAEATRELDNRLARIEPLSQAADSVAFEQWASQRVACPVCQFECDQIGIESHLETCLEKSSEVAIASASAACTVDDADDFVFVSPEVVECDNRLASESEAVSALPAQVATVPAASAWKRGAQNSQLLQALDQYAPPPRPYSASNPPASAASIVADSAAAADAAVRMNDNTDCCVTMEDDDFVLLDADM